ncbi:MAG: precorrin-6y C5,15-methyltransferase (decarboxylating) subunit CbiE [Acidimicrobiales bacterium]
MADSTSLVADNPAESSMAQTKGRAERADADRRLEDQVKIDVVGLLDDGQPATAEASHAIHQATVLVGGARLMDRQNVGDRVQRVNLDDGINSALDLMAVLVARGERVCVLSSGDPGFFGIGRSLSARFGSSALRIHPAPSSVSVAFARLGLAWDGAVVVSAHGRPLEAAIAALDQVAHEPWRPAAILTSPDSPAERISQHLVRSGWAASRAAAVASRLGGPDESMAVVDLGTIAASNWDPLSVLVLLPTTAAQGATIAYNPVAEASSPTQASPRAEGLSGRTPANLVWGRPDAEFAHRNGMVTSAEVRAVIIAKLELPVAGVLWDLGSGSGSVSVECSLLAPGLEVWAMDRDPEAIATTMGNAELLGARINTRLDTAPAGLAALPDPERVFVGGGGMAVLQEAWSRLRPGGRLVASFAAVDRAAAAYRLVGNLVEISVNRGCHLPDGGVRLAAGNPVFVVWGCAAATDDRCRLNHPGKG